MCIRDSAEALWEHSQAARSAGQMEDAGALLEKAIDARGPVLCADLKAGRDRVIEMRRALVALRVDGDKAQAARDKIKLASDLENRGEYEEALVLYEEAVAGFIEVHGHDHPDVAASYSNIGCVYEAQGRYQEALDYYQKALKIDQEVHGSDHLDVANSKYNIACVHESQGNLQEAKALFLECEKIYAKVFGDEHEETQDARERAATVGE